MKIRKTTFPEDSVLSCDKKSFDYIDSFKGEITNGNISSSEMGKAFFTCGPQWGKKMFAFRNAVVGLFGLKTGDETSKIRESEDIKCEVGDRVGLFKVFSKTNNEIVLGEDDKHLDFRVSLLFGKDQECLNENSLIISTTVKFHNWLGILYFLPVRPFHKLIVPSMLKRMISQLEGNPA